MIKSLMTRNQRIRLLLLEGPATTSEISASIRIKPISVRIGIWDLQKRGHVDSIGSMVPERSATGWIRSNLLIYRLTQTGKEFCLKPMQVTGRKIGFRFAREEKCQTS